MNDPFGDKRDPLVKTMERNSIKQLADEQDRLRSIVEQIAAVAKDNHSEDKNKAAMALRFVEDLATRALMS